MLEKMLYEYYNSGCDTELDIMDLVFKFTPSEAVIEGRSLHFQPYQPRRSLPRLTPFRFAM